MKIKKIKRWLYLIFVAIFMNISCQNSDQKNRNYLSQTSNHETRIDSSYWLKETRGIRDILEDSNGNLWFSSPDYVAKYDGKTLHYFFENEGLKTFGNIHEDKNGTIWIEDGFNIYNYKGKRFEKYSLFESSPSNTEYEILESLWFQRGLNPTNTKYVEPGIYNITNKDTKFFPFPLKKGNNNKYLYYPTTKAFFGKDSTVWVGTMEKVFGLKDNKFISIGREEMGRQNDEHQMGIRGIFVDSKGKIWIADNGAGVFIYDGKEIENFTKKHNLDEEDVEGNTLHRAFSIAEDSLGNMWFGTVYSGIWMYNPKTDEFNNYTKDDGVRSENIWMIYKNKKGDLLFAGESPAAIYTFNGKAFDRIY